MEKSETHFMSNSVNGVEKNGNTEQKKATCKICFEEMKPEQVCSYCDCKSENSHVHNLCLMEWAIRKQMSRESLHTGSIECEVCRSKIYLDLKGSQICCMTEKQKDKKLKDNFTRNFILVVCMLLLSMTAAGCLIGFVFDHAGSSAHILLAVASTLCGVALILFTLFICLNCLKQKYVVAGIKSRQVKEETN